MSENFLQLNQDKTQVLLIGPEAHREELSLTLKSLSFHLSEEVKNLRVISDSNSNFISHIKNITKTGFFKGILQECDSSSLRSMVRYWTILLSPVEQIIAMLFFLSFLKRL